jgi:hypothetical protein
MFLFFQTCKLESHIVPNVYIEPKNESKRIGIPKMSTCGAYYTLKLVCEKKKKKK